MYVIGKQHLGVYRSTKTKRTQREAVVSPVTWCDFPATTKQCSGDDDDDDDEEEDDDDDDDDEAKYRQQTC